MNDISQDAKSPFNPPVSGLDFPVVGLGASAGGLAALITLFEHMPAEPDMAFVVILHLSPKHESNAAAILQNATKMTVSQVQGSTPIERNCIYVIPPAHGLSMHDGHLNLESRAPPGRPIAIDTFFRTLAEAHGERAIGIVLSGTGSDGSLGIARLKELGGVVVAQSPADAEYSGMPDSAISTGNVDIVLPAADIPQKLLELWRNAQQIELPRPESADLRVRATSSVDEAEDALRGIMNLLRKRTGHDFKHYKRATVLRRIERRLQVNSQANLPAYLNFLDAHPAEAKFLLDDMLIGVTNFFRDRPAFEALERDVLPGLFAGGPYEREQVRAWVPGCSSGEEAYTLAVLLCDARSRAERAREIQVFASDIDEDALAIGRQGRYSESIVTDMPPAYLRRYFSKEPDGYRVNEAVRKIVLFANHDILRDPPFSRLDVVSCRNLLIYLNRDAQKNILRMFHFALRPGGYLLLGSSETADVASNLFSAVDRQHRIYRSNLGKRSTRSLPTFPLGGLDHAALTMKPDAAGSRKAMGIAELHQQLLLEKYAPASVVINEEGQIVHSSAGAGRFLRFREGDPSHQLLATIEPSLRPALRTGLFEAGELKATVTTPTVRRIDGDRACNVHLIVSPIDHRDWPPNLTMVVFIETPELASADTVAALAAGEKEAAVAQLEGQLHHKEEQLQTTIERYETSGEELKAANEELQSVNEEMRSATEELETGKEELQSANEELITVNHELRLKIDETSQANDDLQNLISSTEIATVFVDPEMRIKRFTPAAASIFNIIESDIGRSLLDITHRLDYPGLAADAAETFASLRMVEREVSSSDGRCFLARTLPYRTGENHISGAVLAFVDITSRKQAESRMHLGEEHMRLVAASMPDFAILTLDLDGNVTTWSAGAERLFGYSEAEVVGQPGDLIFTPEDRAAGVPAEEMRRAREQGRASDERWHMRKDGSRFFVSGITAPLTSGGLKGYAKIARDVTAEHESVGAGEAAKALAEASLKLKDDFLAIMSHELKHPLNLIQVNAQLLLSLPETSRIPSARKAGETIERCVVAQSRIIDDLLDLSRTQSGKLHIALTPLDLGQAIEPILIWAAEQAKRKHIDFRYVGSEQPIIVLGDVVRVEQVVWNLLSNALKFTGTDGVISVRLSEQDDEAVLEIVDNGRGISPQFLPRVFDMFQQEDGYKTRREGGLGLGLGLTRELVQMQGGTVNAWSAGAGRGATFTVRLPVHTRTDFTPLEIPPDDDRKLSDLRILLVDDSADALESFAMLLGTEGAIVTCANSGPEALLRCRDERFDLIVSDIGMPDMDGTQLIALLRREPSTEDTPAIALTGYGRPQDIEASMTAGFTAHLVKPVDLPKFRRLAKRLTAKG